MKCQYCSINEVNQHDLCEGCLEYLYQEQRRETENMLNDETYINEMKTKTTHWTLDETDGTYREYERNEWGERNFTGKIHWD